jgi:hypothetical protein
MTHERKFRRKKLDPILRPDIYDRLVVETKSLLERRFDALAERFDDIADTNFNPFLLLITAPVYNLYSPFEVAERLQLGKAFHGDDTAFGRFGEEKLLPLFGVTACSEKVKAVQEKLGGQWEPIDRELSVEGRRYLITVKSGPWTMNQSHANAMIDKLPAIHKQTGCPVILGIMYGKYENLNNKPALVETNLGNPPWFDYLVGRDFWEFVSGVKDIHLEVFRAIRQAQKEFGEAHKDETFHEKLVANRLKIAASLRRAFNVKEEEDFWQTLFNQMF